MFNWFVRGRDYYFSQPRLKFEGITLGLAVAVGLLAMPALIYLAGRFTLKPYENGGVFALYGDFFAGLVELKPSYWIVLAGPFLFLCVFRVFRFALRKLSS